jgi:electron transfer flavoprotein alpha subunit
MMPKPLTILVFAEQQDGTLKRGAHELFAWAKRWPSRSGIDVAAVTLGAGAERAARDAAGWGARRVRWMEEREGPYLPLRWLRALAAVAGEVGADVVLCSDTSVGRDLAPRLAARMKAFFLSSVQDVRAEGDRVRIARPLFGGRFIEELEPSGLCPLVLTWRSTGSIDSIGPAVSAGEIRAIHLEEDPFDLRVRVESSAATEARDLTQADVVVCGGRGVGSTQGFQLVRDLADALGGLPAASRAAVDAGYAPPGLQVGQSGKTVQSRLYVALGVSGSLQHRAGMRNSHCVVAVNSDPRAPIMKWADYGIVGDLRVVGEALLAAARRFRPG